MQRVGEVDLRRLATELERDALHGRRRLGQDLPADRGGAREGDHVHRGIGREQFGAGRPGLDDHTQHARRQPAASAAIPKASDEMGVSGLGRRMTEFPAISAAISFWNAMMMAPL